MDSILVPRHLLIDAIEVSSVAPGLRVDHKSSDWSEGCIL